MSKTTVVFKEHRLSFILFLIVSLVSVGQLTNTIYIPAVVLIAHSMHIAPENVQSLIGGYLLTYGVSQFVYGPLSDIYGRRPIVFAGLTIFAIGCLVAMFSNSFNLLFWGCVIQGIGTGVCGVMARTVLRDCYSDHKLQKANSYVSVALIVAPLLAPIIGGFLSIHFGWRAIFVFLLIFAACILVIEYYLFPETNMYISKKYRQRGRMIKAYKSILANKTFLAYMLCLVFTFSGLSVFEASAGVLFTQILHYDVSMVALLFIVPIPGYLIGSYLAAYLSDFINLRQLMLISILTVTAGTVLITLFAFLEIVNIYVVLIPVTIYFVGSGLIFPTATTGALNSLNEYAGTAGAVLGGTQNIVAAVLTIAFSLVPQTTQKPLAMMFIIVTILLFMTYHYCLSSDKNLIKKTQN